MKDAFGREITADDLVIYCTRRSSAMSMNLARVMEVTEQYTRAKTLAGTSYQWRMGRWDPETEKVVPHEGTEVKLSVSNNVIVANGIDDKSIVAKVNEVRT